MTLPSILVLRSLRLPPPFGVHSLKIWIFIPKLRRSRVLNTKSVNLFLGVCFRDVLHIDDSRSNFILRFFMKLLSHFVPLAFETSI